MTRLPPDRSEVLTEIHHPGGHDLGGAPIMDSIETIADDHQRVVEALRSAAPRLESLIDSVVQVLGAGGRLVFVGAGTSGCRSLATGYGATWERG